MNNKIHEKAHTIIQKEVQKRYKKTNNSVLLLDLARAEIVSVS